MNSFIDKSFPKMKRPKNFSMIGDVLSSEGRRSKVSKGRDRMVFLNPEGKWANKRFDANRASSLHDTQREAEKAAKEMLRHQGGGELVTKGEDGRIRSKDTIAPGSDPFPPRDREH